MQNTPMGMSSVGASPTPPQSQQMVFNRTGPTTSHYSQGSAPFLMPLRLAMFQRNRSNYLYIVIVRRAKLSTQYY